MPTNAGSSWRRVPGGTELLLAKAANQRQRRAGGAQAGGQLFPRLCTDDFRREYPAFRHRGVSFVGEPPLEQYGTLAVSTDLNGNPWDLLEPAGSDGSILM